MQSNYHEFPTFEMQKEIKEIQNEIVLLQKLEKELEKELIKGTDKELEKELVKEILKQLCQKKES